MRDEERVCAALECVVRVGDVDEGRTDRPSTVAIRELALKQGLIAWHPVAGRFVLTSSGRARRSQQRARATQSVVSFPVDRRRSERRN